MKFQIKHIQTVASTNLALKELLRNEELPEGTVILADFQTAGRGRGQNNWISEEKKNLLVSILFYPEIPANNHFSLTEFTSLALTDTLKEYNISAGIKWPNDIYIKDKKLAGLLIENSLIPDTIKSSIVGIGLNINQEKFPPEIPNSISLINLLGRSVEREDFLDIILERLKIRYCAIQSENFASLHQDYTRSVYRIGEPIKYITADNKLCTGILKRINENGEIVITQGGEEFNYIFGEIKMLI